MCSQERESDSNNSMGASCEGSTLSRSIIFGMHAKPSPSLAIHRLHIRSYINGVAYIEIENSKQQGNYSNIYFLI